MTNGWRWWGVVALCLLAGSSVALEKVRPPTEPGVAAYAVGAGDQIHISVFGQDRITGVYEIDSAGYIQLIFLGSVRVAGLNVAQIRSLIKTLFVEKNYLKDPSINVQLGKIKPIYVSGFVRKPGAYELRHHSSVNKLIALAGGLGIAESRRGLVSEYLANEGRVLKLQQEHQRFTVKLARLRAELAGKKTFHTPKMVGSSEFHKLEQEALDTRLKALKQRSIALSARKPTLQAHISALDKVVEVANKQIKLATNQISRFQSLSKRGLLRGSTLVALQQTLASFETQRWRAVAERTRVKASIGELDVRISEFAIVNQENVFTEIVQTSDKLKELKVATVAIKLRDALLVQTGGVATTRSGYTFAIARTQNGTTKSLTATLDTLLLPGDVVSVLLNSTLSGSPRMLAPAQKRPRVEEHRLNLSRRN